MCCWPYAQVELEEAPKKKKEEKKAKEYVLVSSDFNVQPIVSDTFYLPILAFSPIHFFIHNSSQPTASSFSNL